MKTSAIKKALEKAYRRAGTQTKLAAKAGLSQGGINEFLNGRAEIRNMTVGTLLKLFPDMEMRFFRNDPLFDGVVPNDIREVEEQFNKYSSIDRRVLMGRVCETIKHYGNSSDQ